MKVGVQFGLFGGAILQLGTKRHHDAYLRDLVTGQLMGCFAMTETGHGSNVQALGTVATYDADTDEFVIDTTEPDASKDYIGNAADARRGRGRLRPARRGRRAARRARVRGADPQVTAQPADGVRIEDDGLKMGLNGVDNGKLWFDGVRVPREALLNRFADVSEDGTYTSDIENPGRRFFTMLGTLVQGRVCVGGAGINASKVALAIAVRYGLQRRQFEATSETEEELLLDYGQHQRRLFPLLAATYALHFAQEVVADQCHQVFSGERDDEKFRRELESRAAGTKALGTWHATRAIQESREACGGAGYLAENRFAALKADTDVFTTFEGDNTVLLQLVAKGLLTDYADEFEQMDQLGMVRFVAGLAVETVVERTSVHKLFERVRDLLPGGDQWDQEAGLLDSDYQLAMLRFREEHILGGVARRLKRGIDSGMNPGEVFSRVQDHVIHAARAHVERLVVEAFVDQGRGAGGRRQQGRARAAAGPARALGDRGGPRLVHGARPAEHRAVQGDQPRDQRAVPQGPAAGPRARRRVRHPRGDAPRAGPDRLMATAVVLPGRRYGHAQAGLRLTELALEEAGIELVRVEWPGAGMPQDAAGAAAAVAEIAAPLLDEARRTSWRSRSAPSPPRSRPSARSRRSG